MKMELFNLGSGRPPLLSWLRDGPGLVGRKVEVGKISENTQEGINLCKHKTAEAKGSKRQSSAKLISCKKGKEKRSDACKGFKSGSKKISSDTVLQCCTEGSQQGRLKYLTDYHEKDGHTDSSCKVVGISDRRITRSCSRLVGRKVEVGEVSESTQKSSDLFKHKTCESKGRKLRSSRKLISCNKRKEKISDAQKVFISSKRISSDSVSLCLTREGRRGRQNNFTDYHEKDGKLDNSCKVVEILDRRVTRSASKLLNQDSHCQTMERQSTHFASKQVVGKADKYTRDIDLKGKETHNSCKVVEVLDRRVTRSASKLLNKDSHCQTMERQSTHFASKQVVGKADKYTRDIDLKGKETHDCIRVDIVKCEKESNDALPLHVPGKRERSKQDFTMGTKLIGFKRKRKQVELQGTIQGWTKEQEVELQRAYFTTKPSPHFWKTVAKLVPGKSAQECFDKVHSDNLTPLCTKPSSRGKKNSPMSGIELFDSAKSTSKKTCKTKYKSHVGRKTVRHLLQKYSHVNQDSEADLFSILEPSVNPSAEALNVTPKHLMQSPESSSKSRNRSSGHKKCLSRLSGKIESPITSPPVLKKVKNMLLHEKYIDQLHTREHKRKVAVLRSMKSAKSQKNSEENSVDLKDIIRTAKEALVSEATDVIKKYRHTQANIIETLSDSEEFLHSDNDEEETVI